MKNARHPLFGRAALSALAAGLLLTPMPAAAGAVDTKRQTFDLEPGGTLVIAADRGSIDVKTVAEGPVEVEVRREVERASEARAAEILRQHEVTFQQTGREARVEARLRNETRGWHDNWNLRVSYRVSVPARFNLHLKTAAGPITVGDLTGDVRAEDSAGHIKLGRIAGAVQAETHGGSIDVAGARSASVEAAAGSIELGEIEDTVTAETHGGSIQVHKAGGKTRVSSAAGSIRLGEMAGEVTAETRGGSIAIEKALAGLTASSAAGRIEVKQAAGSLDLQTHGGSVTAGFRGPLKRDSRIETSAGGIKLTVDDSLAAELDANASAGSVTVDLPVLVQGKTKAHALSGKVNGGGPRLTLRTHGGSIEVKKRAATPLVEDPI
jgi:DUF4097 and DUF4098 domain-containing protein YvlB